MSKPVWRCCGRELPLSQPLLMGVLNVTPDSFSDGGRHNSLKAALAHGLKLAADGADIIDVGGESTRPGAAPVSCREELARVIPLIRELARAVPLPLSIDTRHATVARAALEAGAVIVNDIGGLRSAAMVRAVRESGAGAIIMHMQGTPQTMQVAPTYDDVVQEVYHWLQERVAAVIEAGVAREALLADPGIGFGKNLEHNLALLSNLETFNSLEVPLALGLSRKRLIGELTGAAVDDRLAGSLTGLVWAIWQGVALLRVHDVRESVAARRMATALAGGGRQVVV